MLSVDSEFINETVGQQKMNQQLFDSSMNACGRFGRKTCFSFSPVNISVFLSLWNQTDRFGFVLQFEHVTQVLGKSLSLRFIYFYICVSF